MLSEVQPTYSINARKIYGVRTQKLLHIGNPP